MTSQEWARQIAAEAAEAPAVISGGWLAGHTDISCVQAQHSRSDIEDLALAARTYQFVSAHVLPHWMSTLRGLLATSGTLAGGPVGFPSGGATTATKLAEAEQLLADGAQEIDVVANVARLKSGEDVYVRDEVAAVVDLVAGRVPLRVILELAYLTHDELRRGCDLAIDAGAQYVKTGTGWSGRPTTVEDVEFLAAHVQGEIAIKAAGGIRDLDTVRAMTQAGVVRFGLNATVAMRLVGEADAADVPTVFEDVR